jgi:hypothetical protein
MQVLFQKFFTFYSAAVSKQLPQTKLLSDLSARGDCRLTTQKKQLFSKKQYIII